MCGFVVTRGDVPVDRERVHRAIDALVHRGPDGGATLFTAGDRVALAHRRLAHVGGALAGQPMRSEDGRFTAVVNGEFYDHDGLRRSLVAQGHRFAGRSDSEILVHLWEEEGPAALQSLRGEFALAIYDAEDESVCIARDSLGVKPVHYACDADGRLWIASEAKALFAAGIAARWSQSGVDQLLSMQFLAPGATLFDGVHSLPPGGYARFERGSTRPKVSRPLAAAHDRPLPFEEWEACMAIRQRFVQAVGLRIPEDGKIAFAVSGGFDSSAIVGCAAHLGVSRPQGFSISFANTATATPGVETPWDERAQAEAVIAHVNGDLTVVSPEPLDFLEHLPLAVRFSEGAASNGQLVAKYMLSRTIQGAGFRAVLTGEGADEAFLGYAHLVGEGGFGNAARATQSGLMLPTGATNFAAEFPRTNALFDGSPPTFLLAKTELATRLRALSLRSAMDADMCIVHSVGALVPERSPFAPTDAKSMHSARVSQAAHLWCELALAGYILRTLGDGTELSHSVEGRTPFLDASLFALGAGLPVDLRTTRSDGTRGDKALLRRALACFVPREIAESAKHPFLAPPLPKVPAVVAAVRDLLAPSRLAPFFDAKRTSAFVDAWSADVTPPSARVAEDAVLHLLLTTSALGEQFKLGNSPEDGERP